MRNTLIAMVLFAGGASAALAGDVYTCKAANGAITMQQLQCAAADVTMAVKKLGDPAVRPSTKPGLVPLSDSAQGVPAPLAGAKFVKGAAT